MGDLRCWRNTKQPALIYREATPTSWHSSLRKCQASKDLEMKPRHRWWKLLYFSPIRQRKQKLVCYSWLCECRLVKLLALLPAQLAPNRTTSISFKLKRMSSRANASKRAAYTENRRGSLTRYKIKRLEPSGLAQFSRYSTRLSPERLPKQTPGIKLERCLDSREGLKRMKVTKFSLNMWVTRARSKPLTFG